MSQKIELNQGEIKIKFSSATSGKVSLKDLGLSDEDLAFESGLVRLVFDFEGIEELQYYKVPLLEFSYEEKMAETHWQCDFNGKTILDKIDHHGSSSIILLNRKTLSELEHRHENTLIVHAEFPEPAHIIAEKSFINFFS
ncbi:hypothetical protein SAMN06298216_0641 [Spirosomataceae bacterium TFI 002]|nr:hypothetical protein SAMN06298216_0641 [Spirosomataceae bacterium TFI 002]